MTLRSPRLTALVVLAALASLAHAEATTMQRVAVAPGGTGFVLTPSGESFSARGFNYDRDHRMRLIEDYWATEWDTVAQDFAEMRRLGANVVRVHLQFGKFLDVPDRPNEPAFDRLAELLKLAEREGLRLDITGLGAYRKADTPGWYDALDEPKRWAAQARFWGEVARRCADSPAVFCYDLMNEPVVPGKKQPAGQWVHPFALAGFHYVQHVTLDPAGRKRDEVARDWIATLTRAIRAHDKQTPITVGLLPPDLSAPHGGSGFLPSEIAGEVDFISVHVYPQSGKLDESLELIRKVREAGKPVVVEEVFPLGCSAEELADFIARAGPGVSGWIGFYWGETPEELRASSDVGDAITLKWLEVFERHLAVKR